MKAVRALIVPTLMLAFGGVGVLATPASAATTCTGSPEGPITGDVFVPSGGHCNLQGITVNGNVFVQPGGSLIVGGGTTITGNLTSTNAGGQPSPFGGSPVSVLMCNSFVGGNVNISGSTANVILGDEEGCGGNRIAHNVVLQNNKSGVEVIGNKGSCAAPGKTCGIGGNLIAQGNTGFTHDDEASVEIIDNAVGGNISCGSNNSVSSDSRGNTSGGSATGQCSGVTSPPPPPPAG